METDMKKLQDTADLFEVSFPEYKQLRQCRSDIILVKAVWDMVIFVKVLMINHTDLDFHFYYIEISQPSGASLLCLHKRKLAA